MASYRGHLAFASGLGFIYGGIGASALQMPPALALLGAGVVTIGGLLPDLDSDSGVPVRELFGLMSAVVPLIMMPRLINLHLPHEEVILWLALIYAGIRYGLSRLFKRFTVHRGMFHSIPAMLIAGLAMFLVYDAPVLSQRAFIAVGTMIGFFSHLVLDEAYSVDFRGLTIKLNKYAGSAVKFFSPSLIANVSTYGILGLLIYLAWRDLFAH